MHTFIFWIKASRVCLTWDTILAYSRGTLGEERAENISVLHLSFKKKNFKQNKGDLLGPMRSFIERGITTVERLVRSFI